MSTFAPTWEQVLHQLSIGEDLSSQQSSWVMQEILLGQTNNEVLKQFLLAINQKGESASEIRSFLEVLYQHANLIEIPDRCVDIVGTGGDGANTINISTAAAIVTTAAGARTMKHGNRAASSKSGSADLLEALGIDINLDANSVAECVRKIGIGFAFAPNFHPAIKHAVTARKELGVPTVFNLLGPLANPARPKAFAIGVARQDKLETVARVLADRECEGFVIRSDDGLDEISLSATSTVFIVSKGEVRREIFDPVNLGLERVPLSELRGGDANQNAAITNQVFSGQRSPYREAILINAAVGIAAFKGDLALGVEQQFANGYVYAKQAVDSGNAAALVTEWAKVSHQLANASL